MSSPVQQLWAACPLITRSLTVVYPAASLMMTLLGGVLSLLLPLCNASNVLQRGLIWALPLSFCWRPIQLGPDALFLLLELYMALSLLSSRERTLGSTPFLCWIGVCSMLISTAYVVLMYLLSFVMGPSILAMPIQGIWPIIMACLTIRSLSKPDENSNFWGVVQIPNKWYPVVLTAIFCLISARILWDFVLALAFGFAHENFKLADRFVVGGSWMSLDSSLSSRSGKVSEKIGGDWVPLGGAPLPDDVMESGSSAGQPIGRPTGTVAFSGAGQRLGSS